MRLAFFIASFYTVIRVQINRIQNEKIAKEDEQIRNKERVIKDLKEKQEKELESYKLKREQPKKAVADEINEQREKGETYFKNKEYESAVKCFKSAAGKGDKNAQYKLGLIYGSFGDQLSCFDAKEESNKWLIAAAKQGHAETIAILENFKEIDITPEIKETFEKGLSFYKEKKYKDAAKYFTSAAGYGHADAQFHLGNMYGTGNGVDCHYADSQEWFTKAAKQGHKKAIAMLRSFDEIDDEDTEEIDETEIMNLSLGENITKDTKDSISARYQTVQKVSEENAEEMKLFNEGKKKQEQRKTQQKNP